MNSKDILLAYINTLTDKECKKIYLMLKELEVAKGKYEYYNSDGVVSKDGIIKLTPKQFHNIFYRWGEDKVKACFKMLEDYLQSGKKVKASHYTLLNGWIETQYLAKQRKVGRPRTTLTVRFEDVKSKAQARLYVASVPEHNRSDDVYVNYLVNRYGEEIL